MNPRVFDLVGLGASTLDILSLVDHFPAGRDNQRAQAMVIEGGGPIATAIVAAARLGSRAAMIDTIGDDWAAALVLRGLQADGVDTACLERHPGHTTAISTIVVSAETGQRAIIWVPSSAPELILSDSHRSAIRSATFLHLNGRHFSACIEAVKTARESEVQISFDGGANRFRPELRTLLPMTDICIVAKDFADQYTGVTDASKSAAALVLDGPRVAAVTDGPNGSWFSTREGRSFHQPAFLLARTVDTTGCGDSFHGAFLAGLAKGLTLEGAAALASAVAALNSQKLGGRAGIPSYDEAVEFLKQRGITPT